MSYSSHLMSPLFQAAKLWGSSFFLSFFLVEVGFLVTGYLIFCTGLRLCTNLKKTKFYYLGKSAVCVCVCVEAGGNTSLVLDDVYSKETEEECL